MAEDEVENYMNALTPFMAPVVDQLSIRVVVDSHYERFLPKENHPNVKIEHVGGIPRRQMTTLAGEWGLALHLDSASRGTKAQYLLDFGYTPEILNRNFSLLDIDPGVVDQNVNRGDERLSKCPEAFHLSVHGDVALDGMTPAFVFLLERKQLGCFGFVPIGSNDGVAIGEEILGLIETDASVGTGDEYNHRLGS